LDQLRAVSERSRVYARTEMIGRLTEGTGGSPAARTVMRAVAVITLVVIAVAVVLGVLGLL